MPRARLSKINPALLSANRSEARTLNIREGEDMAHVTLTAEEADLLYGAALQSFGRWCWPDDSEEYATLQRALGKFRRASTITIEEEE